MSESRQPFGYSGVVPDDGDDAAVVARCLEGDMQAFAMHGFGRSERATREWPGSGMDTGMDTGVESGAA